MRHSVATVSLSGTLPQKLEAVAAAGFDAIELFEPDFIAFDGSASDLHRLAAGLGLGIDLYQPFRDFEGMPEPAFRRSLDRAERKFDLMQELGAPLLLVCSNTSPEAIDDPGLAAAQLHELAERAGRRGLRVGYEALAWGRFVNRYAQAWRIVEEAGHPQLGLILDSFHTLSLRDDPAAIAAIPGERIFFLQMADAPLLAMDVLQWARHHRNFPGQGQLDVDAFFLAVLRSGYAGTLSLEIFNDQFRETPNRRTAVDAMRSLLFLEAKARISLERERADSQAPAAARATATRRLEQIDLFDPPSASLSEGYAFVEFAVDDAAAGEFGTFLERFGFTRYGRHRSKAVELYRQGAIEFIVNADAQSPARARFEAQGPCVCALGLASDDPAQAAARAAALLSARYESPRGPGELHLPAIMAPGGTIVHFTATDHSVAADFAGTDEAATEGAGLERVDHIALALAADQFDTWTLFCRAVLGLARGASLDLADPRGLIRSSGLADAARKLRIVLNVSLSQRTHTARQVSATGRAGGGVQHIALATQDIFMTVRRLRDNGVQFVPISANYYDDLAARLDLDEEPVRRMQALDIVYDRSAGGEYWHAYADPFADRFFFEIVQRQGYDEYGAINAAARLAAQEQQRRKS